LVIVAAMRVSSIVCSNVKPNTLSPCRPLATTHEETCLLKRCTVR